MAVSLFISCIRDDLLAGFRYHSVVLLFRCAAKCIKLSAGIQLSGKEGCI